jgi:uncharacterized membrane protein YdjX (TVP38/TMEM64 family)
MHVTDQPDQKRPGWARFVPIAVIVAALAAVVLSGAYRHLSLDTLRDSRAALDAFVAENRLLALAMYILAYALAVTISMPGALVFTLTGGFLFGPWVGGGAAIIAATIGATGVFLAARSAFGNSLRARAGGWLTRLEAGFRENAFNYLLALRLFPGAPFFIVNLVPALLNVSLRDFAAATFIGIIPGTLVYASVGNGLRAAFNAGADVNPATAARALLSSPAVILPIVGLIALALAPIVYKALQRKPERAT